MNDRKRIQRIVKRGMDILFALIGGLAVLPISLLTILTICVCSPEDSPIFKQKRIGYRGELFTVYKFRSMTNEKDADGCLLEDALRLKTWGRVIRRLSIDELPQIFLVLTGKMSWIGPRPLLPQEMAVMTKEEQRLRQSVLPGITGWEAVNEAQSDSRRKMAELDLYYVENWSLRMDVQIFFRTIIMLLGAHRAHDSFRAPKLKSEEIITDDSRQTRAEPLQEIIKQEQLW